MNSITVEASGTTRLLLGLGVAELALTVIASLWIDRTSFPVHLALYFAMGVPWLVACWVALRAPRDSNASRSNLVAVFAIAMLLRVPFLVADPVLSDDVFRYVWDGRVAAAGINPYRYPPGAPELAFLRDDVDIYSGINNKDIPTVYPPLMQSAFRLVTLVSESVFAMKAFFVLVDAALVVALASLLTARGLSSTRVVVYAWSPLAVVEIAGSGHNDVLGVACLVGALLALERGRDASAMALLTLSGLAKLVGFVLAPLFVRFVRARALAVIPILAIAFALPYLGAGAAAFDGLEQYGRRWRGNDGLFHVLYVLTGSLEDAKLVVAACLVALALGLVAWKVEPLRATYLTLGALLVLTTTVHPWYLLWIAPFLCFFPSSAWLYLTLGVALSYHAGYLAAPGEPWEEVLALKILEYAPFFGLLAAGAARKLVERRGPRLVELDSPLP